MASGFKKRRLGKTGLELCPLGVASSYGAPAEAFEAAFEQGVTYFYWGSLRRDGMRRAIRNIVGKGQRDDLVIVVQSYWRSGILMESSIQRGLKRLGIEHADVLLLGWYNQPPPARVLERARVLKEKGLYRFLAVSGHNRKAFPEFSRSGYFDVLQLRYNAVHRGAEHEVFPELNAGGRPGIIAYTATRWGDLLNASKMPEGEEPLRGSDCYRFVLTSPSVDLCLTGPGSTHEMDEALLAIEKGPLAEDEMARFRRIGDFIHRRYQRFGS